MMDRPSSAFEVEAVSGEEFLRLLSGREDAKNPPGSPHGAARRAVFVAPLQDVTGGMYAFPKVTRRVVAAFAYGADMVSLTRTTSSAIELPEVARELADRQREACEQLRVEIERGIDDANLRVPVYEGRLPQPRGRGVDG